MSIKYYIESSTLPALCILGEIEDAADSVESATADKVQKWFEKATTYTPTSLAERIDAVIRSRSYKSSKADPAGDVANFRSQVITEPDQSKAPEVLRDPDMAKHFIDRIFSKFESSVLVERIKMLRKVWKKNSLSILSCSRTKFPSYQSKFLSPELLENEFHGVHWQILIAAGAIWIDQLVISNAKVKGVL